MKMSLVDAQLLTDAPAAQPVSRLETPGWRKRFETKRAQIARRKIDLVWMGDSIIQQFEYAGPEEWRNYRPVWKRFYAHRNAINLGFAGDDTRALLWRALHGGLETIAPKLTILSIGTNNFIDKRHDGMATFAGIECAVSVLRERLPASKILVLGVLPSLRGPWVEQETDILNAALAARYAAGTDVIYRDARAIFLKDGKVDPDCFVDRLRTPPSIPLHPTPTIQAALAEFLEPLVAQILESARQE